MRLCKVERRSHEVSVEMTSLWGYSRLIRGGLPAYFLGKQESRVQHFFLKSARCQFGKPCSISIGNPQGYFCLVLESFFSYNRTFQTRTLMLRPRKFASTIKAPYPGRTDPPKTSRNHHPLDHDLMRDVERNIEYETFYPLQN